MRGTPIPISIALLRIFGVVAKERGLERRRHNRSSIGATRISSLKTPLPSQSHSLPIQFFHLGCASAERERKSLRVHFGQSSKPLPRLPTASPATSAAPSLPIRPPTHHTHPPSLPSLECRASVRPFAKVGGHNRGGQLPRCDGGGEIGPRLRENAPRPCCVAADRPTDGICPPTSIHFDHPSIPPRPATRSRFPAARRNSK